MTLCRLRSALGTHPRLILAMLLAFGIEVLPPPSGLVSHRHTAGDIAHVHAGRIVGITPVATPRAGERPRLATGSGIRRAAARDLHRHVAQPFLAMRGASPLPPGPSLFTSDLPTLEVPAEISAALRPRQARAPPFLDA